MNGSHKHNDDIKDFVKSSLSQFEAEPPADLWDKIELRMRRRRRVVFYRISAIAASVLLLFSLGFLFVPRYFADLNQPSVGALQKTDSGHAQKTLSNLPSANLKKEDDRFVEEGLSLVVTSGQHHLRPLTPETNKHSDPIESKKNESFLLSGENQEIQHIQLSDNDATNDSIELMADKTEVIPEKNQANQLLITDGKGSLILDSPADKKKIVSKWSMAVGYGTTSSIELAQKATEMSSPAGNYTFDAFSSELANETLYFEEVEATTHQSPVTFGVMLSRRWGGKWNVETGLVYTRLGYMVKTREFSNSYREYHNELYYLGIPIGVRLSILDRKRYGIFASQSLIFEKGMAGRTSIQTYTNNVISSTENDYLGIRGVQISSLSGLGAEIKFGGNLSVYGQAGVQIFFLNRTQPYNIRSARMAWPSFQAGLRIQLD